MYVNFGPVGILIGMAVMGLVYQLFHYILENPERVCGPVISRPHLCQLASTESNFTVVFGNMLYWLLLLYLLDVSSSCPQFVVSNPQRTQGSSADAVRR